MINLLYGKFLIWQIYHVINSSYGKFIAGELFMAKFRKLNDCFEEYKELNN